MNTYKITFHCEPDDSGKSLVVLRGDGNTSAEALKDSMDYPPLMDREIVAVEIETEY